MVRSLFILVLLPSLASAGDPARQTWPVKGVEREGLIALPAKAKSKAAPVVFVFHGHGGTMEKAADKFPIHELWPEAICVYLQGVPTKSATDPKGEKSGWQKEAGDVDVGDRDLLFFDAVLAKLKTNYKVDPKQIYCTGHSNGGAFTYLLWAKRGDAFAAVAPSASTGGERFAKELKPKPVLHIAGEKDDLVKIASQKETIDILKKLNGCDADGKPWHKKAIQYPSHAGRPVVAYIHPGGHVVPDDGPALIVKFFQAHAQK